MKKCLLFSPAYNVAKTIKPILPLFADLQVVLLRHGYELSLLIINDHSRDSTQRVLEKFAMECSFLEVRNNLANMGNSANIIAGYQWALERCTKTSLIGCLDSDGEHDPLAFCRHLSQIKPGKCDGLVGSIIYPSHDMNWADLNMMRFLGTIQATLMGITNPFYVQSPGHQLHQPQFIRVAIEVLLPQYVEFYREHYGTFPRWGTHAVIDSLISMAGGKLKSVYLACFGLPPNRDDPKREAQALAALNHQQALRAFAEKKLLRNS